jgi:hypothetical protein
MKHAGTDELAKLTTVIRFGDWKWLHLIHDDSYLYFIHSFLPLLLLKIVWEAQTSFYSTEREIMYYAYCIIHYFNGFPEVTNQVNNRHKKTHYKHWLLEKLLTKSIIVTRKRTTNTGFYRSCESMCMCYRTIRRGLIMSNAGPLWSNLTLNL